MSPLKLGAIGLAPKDVAYLRALVRLFSHTDGAGWAFAEQEPFDAVVIDRSQNANPVWFASFDGPVLSLVDPPGAPDNDTVAYPVHAEQFRAWLKLRREKLLAAAAIEAASAPAGVAPASMPAPASVPDNMAAASAPNAVERRYQLRRWPSPAVLQGNELHLKIATLIARNALSMARVAVLSGRSEAACMPFIAALREAGLLTETVVPVPVFPPVHEASPAAEKTAGMAAAAAAAATVATVQPAPVRSGLLASLRRHLGL